MSDTLTFTWAALVAVAVIGFVTPHLVAYLTDPSAPAWVTGPLAGVIAGLGAVATYLVSDTAAPDWKAAVTVFLGALVAAAGYRTTVDPGTVAPLKARGLRVGAGR